MSSFTSTSDTEASDWDVTTAAQLTPGGSRGDATVAEAASFDDNPTMAPLCELEQIKEAQPQTGDLPVAHPTASLTKSASPGACAQELNMGHKRKSSPDSAALGPPAKRGRQLSTFDPTTVHNDTTRSEHDLKMTGKSTAEDSLGQVAITPTPYKSGKLYSEAEVAQLPVLSSIDKETPLDSKHFRLLELPLEVREKIYTFAFEEVAPSITLGNGTRRTDSESHPPTLPPVCYTSKRIQLEASLAYLRRTEIKFLPTMAGKVAHSEFIEWLETFPDNQGFESIRNLSYIRAGFLYHDSFCYMGDWAKNRHPYALISRCPGLQDLTLRISLHVDMIHNNSFENRDRPEQMDICLVTEQEWRANHKNYNVLFSLKALRTLNIEVYGTFISFFKDAYKLDPTLQEGNTESWCATFVTFMRAGFKQRGGEFEFNVQCLDRPGFDDDTESDDDIESDHDTESEDDIESDDDTESDS